MNPEKYNDLVNKNVTKTYKKSNKNEVEAMNRDAKYIEESANLSDRIDKLAEKSLHHA